MGCLWAVTGRTRCQREQRRREGAERIQDGRRETKGKIMRVLTGDVQESNGITRSLDSQWLTRINQSTQRRVYGLK